MYKRFRKYTGKTEIKRMKEFLRRKYPKEMLIDDRSEKIKSIDKNKKAVIWRLLIYLLPELLTEPPEFAPELLDGGLENELFEELLTGLELE